MDLGIPGDVRTDAIGVANRYGETEVVTLLEIFKENPMETRHTVRVELGWYDLAAAEMFALVVFVSDELLQIKDSTPAARFFSMAKSLPVLILNLKSHSPSTKQADFGSRRFFSIATQLPLELQMVLCYRFAGSGKEIITGEKSEVAFKELARRLW